MKAISVALLLIVSSSVNANVQLEWDWMISSDYVEKRESTIFVNSERNNAQSVNALLDAQITWKNWTGLFAIKGNELYSNESQHQFDAEFVVQELFWQSSFELGTTSLDMSVGKMRLDWGVGYGYRPLDVFKPYRRNPVVIQVEEGAGAIVLSTFEQSGEWSLIYSDSSWNSQAGSELSEAAEQQGIGIRRYMLVDNHEWQGLVYYDDVRHGLVAGSLVTVLNSELELHGSALYQRQYQHFSLGSVFQPVELQEESHGYQALIGLSWANAVGHHVIAEYWYDSRAWDKEDWHRAFDHASMLKLQNEALLASSYALGYQQVNLVQHNIMLHWTLDSSAWEHWNWSQNLGWLSDLTPTLDIMYSPDDRGVIATQWLNYQAFDSGDASMEMELAARFFTGSDSSAYANLQDKYMILFNLKGKF